MKKFIQSLLQKALLCLLFLAFSAPLFASHFMGADITYECLGNGQYHITLTIYRDCAGLVDFGPTESVQLTSSGGCTLNATLNQVGQPIDASPVCATALTVCDGAGNTTPGVQLYIFEGIVTLPPNCGDWTFAYSGGARNADISNLVNPQGNWYVEATLSGAMANSGQCNSSPTFSNPPIPYICAGQPFNFNHGAIDVDGDSLVFSLIAPSRNGPNDQYTYTSGLSPTCPLQTTPSCGLILCSVNSGTLQFTPTAGVSQNAVITMLVEEYRNGVLIGSTMRDIQVVIRNNCTNSAVSITTPINIADATTGLPINFFPDFCGGGTFVVCPNTSFTFNQEAADPDVNTTIGFNTNLGTSIPGSAVIPQGGNPYQILVFVNGVTQTSNFTITFSDDACPFPSRQTVGYQVYVPEVSILGPESQTFCGGVDRNLSFEAYTQAPTGGIYQWTQISGPPLTMTGATTDSMSVFLPANVTVPLGFAVSLSVNVAGTICVATDTVYVNFEVPTLSTTIQSPLGQICQGNQVCLDAHLSNDFYSIVQACDEYEVSPVPYALIPTPGTGATAVTGLGDDNYAGPFNIGFPFTFYCNPVTQFWVSSNGFITFTNFGPGLTATGCCSGQSITGTNITTPNNLVALAWNDLNFTASASCNYFITGVAPNRKLVVNYINVPNLGSTTALVTGQIVLNETSNAIDIFSTNARPDASAQTQGVVGTQGGGTASPGRNATTGAPGWPAVNDGYRFIPLLDTLRAPVTYNWPTIPAYNDTLACFNPTITTFVPVEATYQECTYRDTIQVVVGGDLAAPVLNTCNSGVGQVQFVWNAVPGAVGYEISLNNGQTFIATVTNTAATRKYTVTGLSNGECTQIAVRAIGLTPALCGNFVAFFQCCAQQCMTFTNNILAPSCFGVADGVSVIMATGAVAPVRFTLLQGNLVINAPTNTTAFQNLAPGNYSVEILDNLGCIDTISFVIPAVSQLVVSIATTDETCNNNGTVTLSVSGATPPYIYNWTGTALQTPTITGLNAGTYSVTVVDSRGCNFAGVAQVPFDGPVLNATPTADTICPGQTVQLDAIFTSSSTALGCGASTPLQTCGGPVVTTSVVSGQDTLSTLDGTPFNGFFEASKVQMLFLASELNAMGITRGNISELSFDVVQKLSNIPFDGYNISLACTNATQLGTTFLPASGFTNVYSGSVTTTLGTNTFPFLNTYTWDGISNLCVQICFTNTNSPAANFADRVRGGTTTFNAVASAENDNATGCNFSTAVHVGNQRPNITFNHCSGLAYTWAPGATLSATNIANPVASPVATTDYVVMVSDGNCPQLDTVHIVVAVPSVAPTAAACTGVTYNSVTLNWHPLPGITSYEVSSDGGATWTVVNDTMMTFNGLGANTTVTIEVRATGGSTACPSGVGTFSCTTSPCSPPIISSTPESCFGGFDGALTVNGNGTGPFDFALYNGTVQLQTGSGAQVFGFTGLTQGFYNVEVFDQSTQCLQTVSVTVTGPTAPISLSMTAENTSCPNGNDGTAGVSAAGGTGAFTYSWSSSTQTTASVTGLSAGSHSVTVTDANGCSSVGAVSVESPTNPLTVTLTHQNPLCNGGSNGRAFANVVNGQGPLTYTWSAGTPGPNSPVRNGLSAGFISVTVTDSKGCTATATDVLTNIPAVTVSLVSSNDPCAGTTNGQLTVLAGGGTAGYEYLWAGPRTGATITGLAAGNYTVTVSDSNDCTAVQSFTLNPAASTIAIAFDAINPCENENNGYILANPTGGSGGYNYTWSNSPTSAANNQIGEGSYTVTVTDSNGCTATASTALVAIPTPDVQITVSGITPQNDTFFLNSGVAYTLGANLTGAEAGVTYTWSFPTDISSSVQSGFSPAVSSTLTSVPLTISVLGANGNCIATDDAVFIFQGTSLLMANVFTPGTTENYNDTFGPIAGGNITIVSFRIFDRWGKVVFEATPTTPRWDGKLDGNYVPRDAYIYQVIYTQPDLPDQIVKTGDVTLLR